MAADGESNLDSQAFWQIREKFLLARDTTYDNASDDHNVRSLGDSHIESGRGREDEGLERNARGAGEMVDRASRAPQPALAQTRPPQRLEKLQPRNRPSSTSEAEFAARAGEQLAQNHAQVIRAVSKEVRTGTSPSTSRQSQAEHVADQHTTSTRKQPGQQLHHFHFCSDLLHSRNALKRRVGPMEDVSASIEPNDTQYIPSQVLHDYIKNKHANNEADHANGIASESGPNTYVPGESGHIDLALDLETNGEQEHGISTQNSRDADSEDELVQSQSQNAEATVTSPIPLSPMTPAVTGQKRDRDGNAASQSTPLGADDFAAMFKAPTMEGAMGLSQVFKQTQAATSPLPDGIRSDPIFERPSPDFRAPYSQYSPGLDSPDFVRNGEAQGATADPRGMYVSMKDSQEVRNKQKQQARLGSTSDGSGDEDELGEDSEQRRAEHRRRRAEIDLQSRREFAVALGRSSAPEQLGGRTKKIDGAGPVETPAHRNIGSRIICISDDTPRVPVMEEEEFDVSDDGSRDEYDEFNQDVISSIRRRSNAGDTDGVHKEDVIRPTSSPLPFNHQRGSVDTRLTRTFHGGLPDDLNQDFASGHGSSLRLRPSQSVKVADSQPDKVHGCSPSSNFRHHTLPSSVNSKNFVSQSQGLSNSINLPTDLPNQSEIPESSSIPHAPRNAYNSDADDLDEVDSESPPSSPPPAHTLPGDLSVARNGPLSQSLEIVEKGSASDQVEREKVVAKSNKSPHLRAEPRNSNSQPGGKRGDPIPTLRKPIRTIVDTSPVSSNQNQSAPHTAGVGTATGSKPNEHLPKAAMEVANSGDASRNVSTFDTAPTHQSASTGVDTNPPELRQASRGVARIRKLKSIAHSPKDLENPSSFEATFDILNEDDQDYQAAMARPSQNDEPSRQKVKKSYNRRKALEEPAPEANILPPPNINVDTDNDADSPVSYIKDQGKSLAQPEPLVKGKLKKPTASARRNLGRRAAENVSGMKDTRAESLLRPAADQINEDEAGKSPDVSEEAADDLVDSVQLDSRSRANIEPHDRDRSTATKPDGASAHLQVRSAAASKNVFSNRVLARFKDGRKNYFYAATVLDRRGAYGPYTVLYDDGNVDEDVSPTFVRSLNLRPGDIVKVDKDNLRGKDFTVRGLSNILRGSTDATNTDPPTDNFGHTTVLVEPRHRESLPGGAQPATSEALEVGISEIYLTSTMWSRFADRIYEHGGPPDELGRVHTPMELLSRPGTPSSRNRRQALGTSKAPTLLHDPLSAVDSKTGLFTNMVFAITYNVKIKGRDQDKDLVSKMISDNGGRLLPGSFDELFERSAWLPNSSREVDLTLSPASANLGFVALITDGYSRRVKYIQALALNIPCLSGRWVVDSVAKRSVLPWAPYLLPAGESDLLGGLIRSRTFSEGSQPPADASVATLKSIIAGRPNLLRGQHVIAVMEKKGKNQTEARERRQLHVLLCCALGAGQIVRVKDLAEGRKLLEQEPGHWEWLNVGDDAVDEANALLRGDGPYASTAAHRKRRKTGDDPGQTIRNGVSPDIKIVGEEFAVQSLIVGALMDVKV